MRNIICSLLVFAPALFAAAAESIPEELLLSTFRVRIEKQLSGAAVGSDGRAVRIGAEGLIAKRTGIVASGLGMQALISDEDVERLRTLRREDLPGQPLVWQVALRHLIADLTGRPALAEQ